MKNRNKLPSYLLSLVFSIPPNLFSPHVRDSAASLFYILE